MIEDKRFTSIDVSSFKTLCNALIKSREYGKYTKINTLEIIVENLEKRDLEPKIAQIVENMSDNMDGIKRAILNNDSRIIDSLINNY